MGTTPQVPFRWTTSSTSASGLPRPSFDASIVNPIPIESLTMKPNPANGTKHETVTGTITLERKAGMETTVVVSSDSENAVIAINATSSGG